MDNRQLGGTNLHAPTLECPLIRPHQKQRCSLHTTQTSGSREHVCNQGDRQAILMQSTIWRWHPSIHTLTRTGKHTHTHTHTLPNKKDAGRGKRATFNIIQHNFGRNERRHDSGPKPTWWHTSSRRWNIPTNFAKGCCLFSSCAWTRIAWTSFQLCAAWNKKCKHTSIPPNHLDGNPHIQTSNTKKHARHGTHAPPQTTKTVVVGSIVVTTLDWSQLGGTRPHDPRLESSRHVRISASRFPSFWILANRPNMFGNMTPGQSTHMRTRFQQWHKSMNALTRTENHKHPKQVSLDATCEGFSQHQSRPKSQTQLHMRIIADPVPASQIHHRCHGDSTIHSDAMSNLIMTKSHHVKIETEASQTSKSKFAGLDIRTIEQRNNVTTISWRLWTNKLMKIPSFMPNQDRLLHVQQLRETLGHDYNHIYDSSFHFDSIFDTKVAIFESRNRLNDKIRQKHINHRKSYSTKYTRLEKIDWWSERVSSRLDLKPTHLKKIRKNIARHDI